LFSSEFSLALVVLVDLQLSHLSEDLDISEFLGDLGWLFSKFLNNSGNGVLGDVLFAGFS
jgi:hypothetical protein